jgi:hypothetical protein
MNIDTSPPHSELAEVIRRQAFRYQPVPNIDVDLPVIKKMGTLDSVGKLLWIRIDSEDPSEMLKIHIDVEDYIDQLSTLIFEGRFNFEQRREDLLRGCYDEIKQTINRIARLQPLCGKRAINGATKLITDAFKKNNKKPDFFDDTFPENLRVDLAVMNADSCIMEAYGLCKRTLKPILLKANKKGSRALYGHLAICFSAVDFWPGASAKQAFESIKKSLTRSLKSEEETAIL